MQGGHHPKLTKQWYLDLLSHIRTKYPQINVHGFSPSEFVAFSEFFNEPVEQLLKEFVAAGLGSVPGGGGEILVERVRNRIAPLKANATEWMSVMDKAHELGLASSITMMFGHVETLEDRIEHLERLRQLQDETGGFTAFICWTHQPPQSPPWFGRDAEQGRKGGVDMSRLPPAGAFEYLKTQAVARLYLDNIPNIQSSWVTQGEKIGQLALFFGANDMGSLMIEENVVAQAGTVFHLSLETIRRCITDAGYIPRQRNVFYEYIDAPPAASLPEEPTVDEGCTRSVEIGVQLPVMF
jgi:cyclic dehypoxanthinyl futalosine synthase